MKYSHKIENYPSTQIRSKIPPISKAILIAVAKQYAAVNAILVVAAYSIALYCSKTLHRSKIAGFGKKNSPFFL